MPEYLDIPFESNADSLTQLAFDYLVAVYPDWAPSEGNLDVMFIRAIAQIAAEVQDIASSVPTTIFRYFGANIANLQPQDAVAAQGATTWVMNDNAGYTIPAGTLIAISMSGNESVAFETLADVVVPPGSTATADGEVLIEAVIPGAESTGLTGDVFMLDSLGFVNSITLLNPTTGGLDAESDDAYLNRLVLDLRLLAPRPIIPTDFSAMATSIPGVYRALAIDGYNPDDGTFNNPRMIAVAAVDTTGTPVSSTVLAAVQTLLDGSREVNFIVNTILPTISQVDVTYTVKGLPGFNDATDLVTRVNAAISDYLSPANWGIPPAGDSLQWVNENTVRYLSLSNAIQAVQGVRYVESLTLGLAGGSQAAADLVLPGIAVLADTGTLTGSADLD